MEHQTYFSVLSRLLLLLLLAAAAAASPASRDGDAELKFEVCYEGLGCFRNDGNFYNLYYRPLSVLPQSPDKIGVKFFTYTRAAPTRATQILFNNADSVRRSGFNPSKETKVIVHGFTDSTGSGWMARMKDGLLRIGDYNVILLDWSGGNSFPYTQATANTRVVGAQLGQLINWLQSNAIGGSARKFHLIGHSLGAHISGYAGTVLKGSLGRITGMDPAGPYFEFTHPEVRLDHTDAQFVDAIHTDGSSTLNIIQLKGGFGMMQEVGHVDFYPNGGKVQPGCRSFESEEMEAEVKGAWLSCHHTRVIDYMIATIENSSRRYNAIPCDSYENFKADKCQCGVIGCSSMGINANIWRPLGRKNVRMFLDTTGNPPYEVR